MRKLRVVELQGPKALLRAYGVAMPANFSIRWFGDDADISPKAMDEVAFINQSDFRWACDISMAANSETTVSMPAKVNEVLAIDLGIVRVVYEYKRFFGLIHRKFSSSIAVGSRENRKIMESQHAA
jgi:hypothetical protein